MRATDPNDLLIEDFLSVTARAFRRVRNLPRAACLRATFLGLTFLLACSFGCAPASSTPEEADGKPNKSAAASDSPELNEETIRERINDAFVRQVPEENGASDPINWSFDEEEPKEFNVVDKQIEGERAIVILDIKTGSAPRARSPRYLAGQIRTKWELRTGWVLRRWEIVDTENISMKYKNLPKPPAQNSNR